MKIGSRSAGSAGVTAVALLLTLISSIVVAAPNLSLVLVDSFDYTNGELKHAYLDLDYAAGTLVLSFSHSARVGALPPIRVDEGPVFTRGAVPKRRGLAAVFDAVTLDYRGHTLHAARFTHQAGSMAEVVAAYRSELKRRGFQARFESGIGNIQVYRFESAEGALRIVFSRTEGGARAFIAAL